MIVKLKQDYYTRGGDIVRIKSRASEWEQGHGYSLRGITQDGKTFTYTKDGFFYLDKSFDSLDLMRKVRTK